MSCEACKTIPPVKSSYEPKGLYTTLGSLKCYTIAETKTPTRAIICIYDVFGMHPHTQQGADALAAAMPDTQLIMPDLFDGEGLSLDLLPVDTPEKRDTMQRFMSEKAGFQPNVDALLRLVADVKTNYPSVGPVGAYGLCWGGKVIALASRAGTPLAASATAHPGRVEVDDARALTIPHAALFSRDDATPEIVAAYSRVLDEKDGSFAETYADMHHGWMGARAKLDDPANVKEFERGYRTLAEFFAKHLKV